MARNKLGRGYDRSLGLLLPGDRLLSVLFCLMLNCGVYWGAMLLTRDRYMLDMTTALDEKLPFAPGWAVIYVLAYGFWAVNYVLLARGGDWYGVMTAEVLAKLLCGAMFLLLPTTNVRPALPEDGLGPVLLGLIYRADAPMNLFPSIHCLESWICWAGLRRRQDIPRWYRWASWAMAVLICASTVLVRQHVLADVAAGVLLAEGALGLSRRCGMGARLRGWMTALDRRIFG